MCVVRWLPLIGKLAPNAVVGISGWLLAYVTPIYTGGYGVVALYEPPTWGYRCVRHGVVHAIPSVLSLVSFKTNWKNDPVGFTNWF